MVQLSEEQGSDVAGVIVGSRDGMVCDGVTSVGKGVGDGSEGISEVVVEVTLEDSGVRPGVGRVSSAFRRRLPNLQFAVTTTRMKLARNMKECAEDLTVRVFLILETILVMDIL